MCFTHTDTRMLLKTFTSKFSCYFYNLELLQSDFAGTDVFIMIASGVKEKYTTNRILTRVSAHINEELWQNGLYLC